MPHLDERLIDDPDEITRLDPRGYLRALATAGAQVRQSVHLTDEAAAGRAPDDERPRAVVVCAAGGSAVVADVLAELTEAHGPVPVARCAGGPLPAWVGPMDLVVTVSSTGRAPGPLRLAADTARRGARLVSIAEQGSPLAEVTTRARGLHVPTPQAAVTSCTSMWSLLTPALLACAALHVVHVTEAELLHAADVLDAQAESCRPSSESFVNPAKLAAVHVVETIPVVLGDGSLMGVAATRAASTLARTARIPAMAGALPDHASQIVATFGGPFASAGGRGAGTPLGGGIFADPFLDAPEVPPLGLLLLGEQGPQVRPQQVALAHAVLEQAGEAGVRTHEVVSHEAHPLARLAEVVALTDFAAAYAAIGLGLDPATSPHVAELRAASQA